MDVVTHLISFFSIVLSLHGIASPLPNSFKTPVMKTIPQVLSVQTAQMTPTPAATPSAEPTETFAPSPTPTMTPLPTATPTPSPLPSPTSTPTPTETATPRPTNLPTATPIPESPLTSQQLDNWFTQYSQKYSVDRQKLWNIAVCESSLNPHARNGDYGGMYQFATSTWISTRTAMNEDTNPDLRFSAEEAIKTAAFKISTVGVAPWPSCSK